MDAIVNTVIHLSSSDLVTHESVVGNARNLLADDGLSNDAVALVANGGGVSLFAADAPQRERVAALAEEDVALKACGNTLVGGDLTEEDLVDAVEIVPSGIGEVARLQSEEDYAYFEA